MSKSEDPGLSSRGAGPLPVSDAELVEQAARGDAPAFATLMERHAPGLFRLAYALVGNRADAEDVLQEAFLGAYRGLRGFQGRSSVRTWLGQILVHQALALRRARQMRRGGVDSGANGPTEPAAEPSATGEVDRREDVMQALVRLSPEHREAIVLREFEHMSYEQIAVTLGVPRGTVESRLHRARAELRTLLSAYGTSDGRMP
jgi:RNA polymerase sigma-70 factor, ECF subfamily